METPKEEDRFEAWKDLDELKVLEESDQDVAPLWPPMPQMRRARTCTDCTESSQRRCIVLLDELLQDDGDFSRRNSMAGEAVTCQNIRQDLAVVRGPAWKWAEEDRNPKEDAQGSCFPYSVGDVLSFDPRAETATVRWRATGDTYGHYRLGDADPDLFTAPEDIHVSPLLTAFARRRNSQMTYADPSQTAIILDWDDTLFPTTFIREDEGLKWNRPLHEQDDLSPERMAGIQARLISCGRVAAELIKEADKLGKVIIVSLARAPWVDLSCKLFYPEVGELLQSLNVQIVYAQEGEQVDYDKAKMMSGPELLDLWAGVKSRAISRALAGFYSQYEGQSWKNVISIGDSDFERIGTRKAVFRYLKMKGLTDAEASVDDSSQVEIEGHSVKVRVKTFKLVDKPTTGELQSQLALLITWINSLVYLDDAFDFNLEQMDNFEALQHVESRLFSQSTLPPDVSL